LLVCEKRIEFNRTNHKKRLYFIGDIHAGTIAHSETNLNKAIKEISKDDDAIVIGMGDYAEFITPKDKRYDDQIISDWVKKHDIAHCQEEYIIEKFRPIKDKIIGFIRGNHESTYHRHNYGDVQQHICDGIGIKNLGFSCFFDLLFHRANAKHRYRLCLTHGSTGACTDSWKNTVLKRWIDQNDATIYAYAHVHDIIHKARQYLSVNQIGKIVNREAMGVMTGCFFKTYVQGSMSTYGEEKNLPPVKLGYPIIELDIPSYQLNFTEKVDLTQ